MGMDRPELIHRDVVYDGDIITVHRDTLRQGDQRVTREVVDHADSVAVVVLDERRRVLLVRQYRHPVGGFLQELPAGLLDPGEDSLDAAKRELEEETGLTARHWERLVDLHPSPGMTGEKVRLYLARGLDAASGGQHTDPDEQVELHWVPFEEALERVRSGEITNGLAVAGLLAASGMDRG
jgi:nudix-type nucleoside diphosphatase (YffH/AdpP family)